MNKRNLKVELPELVNEKWLGYSLGACYNGRINFTAKFPNGIRLNKLRFIDLLNFSEIEISWIARSIFTSKAYYRFIFLNGKNNITYNKIQSAYNFAKILGL